MNEIVAGKVAVITGGASGIGKAVAARLAARGARVVLAGRNRERGEKVAAELASSGNAKVTFVQADVSRETEVESLIERAACAHGRLDYLFNNAGVEGINGPMSTNTEESVDEVLAINVKGVFLCMKHAAPRMAERGGGTIVNTASFVGTTVPLPDAVIYGATKAAVLSMTRSAATGCAERNIRVYAVCPWITDTPMVDRLTGYQPQAKAQFGGMNPSGKIATPEDIAGGVVAMFGGEADIESGDAVLVDSGGAVQRVRPLSV